MNKIGRDFSLRLERQGICGQGLSFRVYRQKKMRPKKNGNEDRNVCRINSPDIYVGVKWTKNIGPSGQHEDVGLKSRLLFSKGLYQNAINKK